MKKINGNIASPKGFKADGIHCGLKRKRKDIGWIISTVPAQCAGVFTTNQVKAAPVLVTKEKIKNKSQVRHWVNIYKAFGEEGLRQKKKRELILFKPNWMR